MQIVIDIPDRIYKINQNRRLNITDAGILEKAVRNGTPLPKGHGRLIDAEEVIKIANKTKDIHGAIWNAPTVNAIPIPDGATNGDMIMAMFPNAKANVFVKEVGVKGLDTYSTFTKTWWNAPYEGGKDEKRNNR